MTQSTVDQVMATAQTDSGSLLVAECPRTELRVARAILEQLYNVHRRVNWHVEIRGGVCIIACDKAPNYGYTVNLANLGKGYTGGAGLRPSVRKIGLELLERIEAGVAC